MPRFASSILLIALLLATVPTADAQFGGLLDRAKRALTGDSAPETHESARADASSTQAGAAGLHTAATLPDGSPAPVIDTYDLLTMTYHAQNGLLDPDHLTVIFPIGAREDFPTAAAEFTLRDGAGTVVHQRPLYEEASFVGEMFRTLSSRNAGPVGPLPAGAYTAEVVYKDHLAGRLAFSVDERTVGDAYAPRVVRPREGPWRVLGAIEHPTQQSDQPLRFSAWVHPDDLDPTDSKIRLELTRDGAFVADRTLYMGAAAGWALVRAELQKQNERGQRVPLRIDDIQTGSYTLSILREVDGHIIKTFTVEGSAGEFVPHPRSALGAEPHVDHLTPRRPSLDTRGFRHGEAERTLSTVVWLEANASP